MHETFCEILREDAVEKIKFLKNKIFFKKIRFLTKDIMNHMIIQKYAIIVKKNWKKNMKKMKSIAKLATIITMQVNIEVLHTTYVI